MVFSEKMYGYADCLAQLFQVSRLLLRELVLASGQKERRLKTSTAIPTLSDIHGQARTNLKSKPCSGGTSHAHRYNLGIQLSSFGERGTKTTEQLISDFDSV